MLFLISGSGLVLGFVLCLVWYRWRLGGFQKIAEDILKQAEKDASDQATKAEKDQHAKLQVMQKEWEKTFYDKKLQLNKQEERVLVREERLDARMQFIEKKIAELEKKEAKLEKLLKEVELQKNELSKREELLAKKTETIAGISQNEAKTLLFTETEATYQKELFHMLQVMHRESLENADKKAKHVIINAINRLTSSTIADHCINSVALPSEELKGRIIGREGRNIRALELATGVNFIMDDTPSTVLISGFDPIRKHIAKLALTELIQDGRIHPSKIEEVVKKHEVDTQRDIRLHGEDAAIRAGILNLHPELVQLLGKLHFRYSFGQNILEHSLEVSKILGLIAAELNLNITLAKRIGLLHDIGKAASDAIEGSHAIAGQQLALKFGESSDVANGIGCHHHEIPASTVEASLCSAADAISGGRPGARSEAIELYFKRLQKLESISSSYNGVEKAYALQAGKEIRVIVIPELIDDQGTTNLARDIAKRIEQEMQYPGKIKVTVIREKKSIEYAI